MLARIREGVWLASGSAGLRDQVVVWLTARARDDTGRAADADVSGLT